MVYFLMPEPVYNLNIRGSVDFVALDTLILCEVVEPIDNQSRRVVVIGV